VKASVPEGEEMSFEYSDHYFGRAMKIVDTRPDIEDPFRA
jgi:hypothetical protein